MTEPILLEKATFEFSQEGNCVEGEGDEFLEISCVSSLGIDREEGKCIVILNLVQKGIL